MTLLYQSTSVGQPGTHVLAIGVGKYPHLLGGDPQKLANKPLGLRQLQSPPASLQALLEWFLSAVVTGNAAGFAKLRIPLASLEAVASSAVPVTVDTPAGALCLAAATQESIQDAFDAWLQRMKSHADNIGVFYFCGHGIQVSEHYLLAEDFGRSAGRPWSNAFDISTTIRAVEREVPGAMFYFIDACRQISREVAMTLGANPSALLAADLSKKVVRKHTTAIYATGEGEAAFAPQGGKISRFTTALLHSMSGYCGIKSPGAPHWDVDGESIAKAVRKLLELQNLEADADSGTSTQVSAQSIEGSSTVPLLQLTTAPKVKVWLDVLPSQRRASYELYLLSMQGNRIAQKLLDKAFRIDVPRGFYEVGAQDPAGALPSLVRPEEELSPPTYKLTLE